MTATMTTVNDLRTWVAERIASETSDADKAAIVEAIRNDPARPAWGDDWSEYFATMPEFLEMLIADEPADDDTAAEPCFVTTIDQHQGDHHTGLPVVELHEVVTRYSDHADGKRWDDLTDADREWWADTLADIHAARVELAELPADQRTRAGELLGAESCDLEDLAGVIRRAVADAKQEGDEPEADPLICGHQIQHDNSGVGHNWRDISAADIPPHIAEEIAAEIIDGKRKTCECYTATNGLKYRW